MAHVTLRTIRYYDKINLLKPTYTNESGMRFYSSADFLILQKILLFKYLGFSLEDIKALMIEDASGDRLLSSLEFQSKLIKDRIAEMQLVDKAIDDTMDELKSTGIDADKLLKLIHLTGMESSLVKQYQNASNISSRISLHSMYSSNKEGWFPWVYRTISERCTFKKKNLRILELGAGDGSLWKHALKNTSSYSIFSRYNVSIMLTDISEGMLKDAEENLKEYLGSSPNVKISFSVCDIENIPSSFDKFDIIIADHTLFYSSDLKKTVNDISLHLKDNGFLIAATYGQNHMKEISRLVSEFDERIFLSKENLYNIFGKENGKKILSSSFAKIEWTEYEDHLEVPSADALVSYILSCHGNQNHYILDHYQDFLSFVKKKTRTSFYISKEAGLFTAYK